MPRHIADDINTRIFSFVWRRRRERLVRSSVTQRISHGGLNLVDLGRKVSAFHCVWVRRLVQDAHHPLTFFFKHFLRVAFAGRSVEQILLLPAPSQTALNLLPPFYRSVMVSWYQLSRRMENGTIFVEGPNTSCSLSSLTAPLC